MSEVVGKIIELVPGDFVTSSKPGVIFAVKKNNDAAVIRILTRALEEIRDGVPTEAWYGTPAKIECRCKDVAAEALTEAAIAANRR